MSRRYQASQFAPANGGIVDAQAPYTFVVGYFAGTPTAGLSGYHPGAMAFDITNGLWYRNTGTTSSATWTVQYGAALSLSDLTATAAELNRSSDMSTRVVDCTASTLAVTEALHDGKIITLNRAAGIAVTLPVPVAGMWFRFVVQTTFTGAASIKSVAGTHIMIGHAIMGNDSDNTTVMWQALAASTYDTIDLLGTGNSTGGIAGQTIDIKALSSTVWLVEIQGDAAGTEATPFSDTVA